MRIMPPNPEEETDNTRERLRAVAPIRVGLDRTMGNSSKISAGMQLNFHGAGHQPCRFSMFASGDNVTDVIELKAKEMVNDMHA
jgi:hypothetical protein